MFDLRIPTPRAWVDAVMADFDAFLLDHAACERKASATGMWFVAHYPDRAELVDPMIDFAREELEHFQRVYRMLAGRGLHLGPDEKDPYVRALRGKCRGGDAMLLDRLLIAGIVEARGCERLHMVAEALADAEPELSESYLDMARAESRHGALFYRMARKYYSEEEVAARSKELLDFEAEVVRGLPIRSAVH